MKMRVSCSIKRFSSLCLGFLILNGTGCSREGDLLWTDSARTTAGDTESDTETESDVDIETGAICTSNSDCEILSNCCYCAAVPRGTVPESCNIACPPESTPCVNLGVDISDVACWNGHCQLPYTYGNCNGTNLSCAGAAQIPYCPGGYLPSVLDDCWSVCIEGAACNWK